MLLMADKVSALMENYMSFSDGVAAISINLGVGIRPITGISIKFILKHFMMFEQYIISCQRRRQGLSRMFF